MSGNRSLRLSTAALFVASCMSDCCLLRLQGCLLTLEHSACCAQLCLAAVLRSSDLPVAVKAAGFCLLHLS